MDYLKKIEEFICDEEKIVTYKWLSQNLKININHAKQLLALFLKNSKSNDFLVTYLVSAKNDEALSIFIATNEDLDNIKSSFKDVSVLNVYSIQKKNTLPDINNLYIVDKNNKQAYLGAVSTPECSKREKKAKGKTVSASKTQEPKKVSASSNREKSQEEKPQTNGSSASKEEIPKQTSKAKKPDGKLASFFNRQKIRNENKAEVPDTATKNDVKEERKEVPSKIVEEKKSTEKNVNEKKKNDSDDEVSVKIVEEKKVEKKKGDNSNGKENKTKKRNQKKKVNTQDKKRKRILQICDTDSSDDDIFGKEEEPNSPPREIDDDVEMIPETPEPQKIPINKRRIRKEVEKTFLDEEGFMITKKETVYESGSDNEEADDKKESLKKVENGTNKRPSEPLNNPVTKKQKTNSDSKTKATKKDKKPPSPKKQPSIMSFFKKKT